jgi:hypothetical protein
MQISLDFQEEEFCCPITHQYFLEPVIATDGHTYEKEGNFVMV